MSAKVKIAGSNPAVVVFVPDSLVCKVLFKLYNWAMGRVVEKTSGGGIIPVFYLPRLPARFETGFLAVWNIHVTLARDPAVRLPPPVLPWSSGQK